MYIFKKIPNSIPYKEWHRHLENKYPKSESLIKCQRCDSIKNDLSPLFEKKSHKPTLYKEWTRYVPYKEWYIHLENIFK